MNEIKQSAEYSGEWLQHDLFDQSASGAPPDTAIVIITVIGC
jgi:hypothetical protein